MCIYCLISQRQRNDVGCSSGKRRRLARNPFLMTSILTLPQRTQSTANYNCLRPMYAVESLLRVLGRLTIPSRNFGWLSTTKFNFRPFPENARNGWAVSFQRWPSDVALCSHKALLRLLTPLENNDNGRWPRKRGHQWKMCMKGLYTSNMVQY